MKIQILFIFFYLIASESYADLSLLNPLRYSVGDQVDSLNDVPIYYNGFVDHSSGRSLSEDGYNLGLKYQCVEFVKRYYFLHLKHRFPNAFGHAKDFFDSGIADGELNKSRGLFQYKNLSTVRPMENDILIFGPSTFNKYGHVAIVSKVSEGEIEIAQQNPGPIWSSRERFKLSKVNEQWKIHNDRVLAWLRKK